MADNLASPNPWESKFGVLEKPEWDFGQYGHPLDVIRDILLQWTGEETVNLDDEERHNRFVRTIAGYPQIDLGRMPFDWPMHPNSIRALELSKLLDSLPSPDGKTSLRSAILNADVHYRQIKGDSASQDTLKEIHKKCLYLLFQYIRIYTDEDPDYYSVKELNLLLSLHSADNNTSAEWYPNIEMFNNNKTPISFETPTSVRPSGEDYEKNKSDETLSEQEKNEKREELRGYSNEWRDYSEAGKYWGNFCEKPNPKEDVRGFNFVKIQTWLQHWCLGENTERLGSVRQRLIRGGSAMLEAIFAKVRKEIIREHGPGSIVIDGGGRITYVLTSNTKNIDLEQVIKNSFILEKNHLPLFQKEIEKIAKIYWPDWRDNKGEKYISKLGNLEKPNKDFYEEIFSRQFVFRHFPVIRIYDGENASDAEVDDYSSQRDEKCALCNKTVIPEDWRGTQSWDSLFLNFNQPICIFHRLLYFSGQATRKNNSSIRKGGSTWKFAMTRKGHIKKQRAVISIARLDLNSLGIIFNKPFSDPEGAGEKSTDIQRRRSFRFNSIWWGSVQESLDYKNFEIDQFASWIAAGDDLLIAEYSNQDEPSPKIVEFLNLIDSILYKKFNLEKLDKDISFCAGYSIKEKNKGIKEMVRQASISEINSKRIWKTRMKEKNISLIQNNDGNEKEFCQVAPNQGEEFLNERYSLILEFKEDFDPQCQYHHNCSNSKCVGILK